MIRELIKRLVEAESEERVSQVREELKGFLNSFVERSKKSLSEVDSQDFIKKILERVGQILGMEPVEQLHFVSYTKFDGSVLQESLNRLSRDVVMACADPLKERNFLLCLLKRVGPEPLWRDYEQKNTKTLIVLTDLFRMRR